jgi:predicted ATP-binding protein involved in virulence
MKLQKIDIKNLFDQFDYEIPLNNPEDLLIITAPNGYGKTMILNIIDSLFNKKFLFFQKLVFDKITMWFDNGNHLEIVKKADKSEIDFVFYEDNERVEIFTFSDKMNKELVKIIERNFHFTRINENEWLVNDDGLILSTDNIIRDFPEDFPPMLSKSFSLNETKKKLDKYLTDLNVYLIKEQRLFKMVEKQNPTLFFEQEDSYMTYSIQEYAQELKSRINTTIQKSFEISQELDSSFLKRLLSQTTTTISKEEFVNRFGALRQKQSKLKKFGLSESEQEIPEYDEVNAKVLLVYLADSEKKISVFEELIQHLALFTTILNERRFTFKTIQINKEKGFHFLTSKGKELSLTDLSSGEQHEVVLLYELIFRTTPNTLVLIDEPEISLHITWQKAFLNDLLAIIQLQKMQVIVATHSPSIVNSRWDLVFNLEMNKMQ